MLCFVGIWHLSMYEVWESERALWRVCVAAWARSWKRVWDFLKNPGMVPEPRLLPAARPRSHLPLLEQCHSSQVSMAFLLTGWRQWLATCLLFPRLPTVQAPWLLSACCSCHHLDSSVLTITSCELQGWKSQMWSWVLMVPGCSHLPLRSVWPRQKAEPPWQGTHKQAAACYASAYTSHPRGCQSWNSTYFRDFLCCVTAFFYHCIYMMNTVFL